MPAARAPLPGALLIVAAAATWGTTGATMKLVEAGSPMSPLLVGFFRVALAAPCLWLAARWDRPDAARPMRRDATRLLAAGLAMGAYQACYFWGVALTSVAVGSLIAICSGPLLITVLAAVLLGERIDRATAGTLALGTAGAALLTLGPGQPDGGPPAGFLPGALLALGAGLCYASYAVLVKDLVARVAPTRVAALTFSVAAAALAPALWAEPPRATAAAWVWLAYLGVVPTALAYVLYGIGLRTTPVTVAGVLTLVEPLTATLLGVLAFGERLGGPGAAGAALLLLAVARLATRR